MDDELLRRAADLDGQCARRGTVTHTNFLTPAEGAALSDWAGHGAESAIVLHGGYEGAERRVAFFLPDWMDAADFDPAEYLCAL